jgi:hypothetical protein
MRRLLLLGAPLIDLSPVGKMRDIYPLVITRIEYMTTLLLKDATTEAVVGLLLSLSFNAIRLETISRETQIFMPRIYFFLVRNLYEAKNRDRTQIRRRLKEANGNIHVAVVQYAYT